MLQGEGGVWLLQSNTGSPPLSHAARVSHCTFCSSLNTSQLAVCKPAGCRLDSSLVPQAHGFTCNTAMLHLPYRQWLANCSCSVRSRLQKLGPDFTLRTAFDGVVLVTIRVLLTFLLGSNVPAWTIQCDAAIISSGKECGNKQGCSCRLPLTNKVLDISIVGLFCQR